MNMEDSIAPENKNVKIPSTEKGFQRTN